jgi:hypothetical protein
MLGDWQRDPTANPSAEHFERTSRPLRIAIDEADWRFHNLTASQVACIQQRKSLIPHEASQSALLPLRSMHTVGRLLTWTDHNYRRASSPCHREGNLLSPMSTTETQCPADLHFRCTSPALEARQDSWASQLEAQQTATPCSRPIRHSTS